MMINFLRKSSSYLYVLASRNNKKNLSHSNRIINDARGVINNDNRLSFYSIERAYPITVCHVRVEIKKIIIKRNTNWNWMSRSITLRASALYTTHTNANVRPYVAFKQQHKNKKYIRAISHRMNTAYRPMPFSCPSLMSSHRQNTRSIFLLLAEAAAAAVCVPDDRYQ